MSHDEELRWVRRREGTHRSGSRETLGYERDLLRENDTEHLLGPTESRPANIAEIIRSHTPEVPPRPTAAQEFRDQVVNAVWNALEPHIKDCVDIAVDSTLDGFSKLVKWAKGKPAQRRGDIRKQSPSARARLEGVPAEATSEVDDESRNLGVQVHSVTAEQYQDALRSALEAEQYAARVRQVLAEVTVHDGAESAAQVALDGSACLIDTATRRRAVERLDSSRTSDVELIPIKNQYSEAPSRTVDQPLKESSTGL